MKRLLLLLTALLLVTASYSQNFKLNKKEAERIKRNGNCYWVESNGCADLHAAENQSLDELMVNIYENCNPSMITFRGESGVEVNPQTLFNTLKNDIKAYSNEIFLSNEENNTSVFRYIKKDDFIGICDKREQLINTTCANGTNALSESKSNSSIGNALRQYYWSLILCCSHPYGSELLYGDSGENNIYMKDWLYDRIDSLLTCIQFIPKKKPIMKTNNSIAYEIAVTDGSDFVPWLKYEYNNGNSYIENSVESGRTSVELTDKDIPEVDIRICLENRKEAEIIAKEAYDIMNEIDAQLYFASSIKKVNLKKAKDEDYDRIEYQDDDILDKLHETDRLISDNTPTNDKDFKKSMTIIEKSLRNKKILDARNCFTDEGFEMFRRMTSAGNYYIIGTPEYKFMEFKDQTICRSIPMQFTFRNNVGFVRDVVFRFDNASGKVNSIAFRLTEIAEIDILGKDQWKSDSRMILINFLEDYQTAYALKRLDYLDKIFSDDALIIVGTVLKQKEKSDNIQLTEQAKIKYDTLSKEKYLGKLHSVFSNNEYVNIRFLDTEFAQHNSGIELYGIRVKQEYMSSNYGDVGYLFLMVDLREELPIIHVRTWEPDNTKEPIGFDDFKVKILN